MKHTGVTFIGFFDPSTGHRSANNGEKPAARWVGADPFWAFRQPSGGACRGLYVSPKPHRPRS
jgi:hypothetical protein